MHKATRHKYCPMPTFNQRIYDDIEKRNDFDFSLIPFKEKEKIAELLNNGMMAAHGYHVPFCAEED